jgi:hypothetical protein
MNRRRILPLLLVLSLGLTAFAPRARPHPDRNAGLILQYLTVVKADGSVEFSYIFKASQSSVDESNYTREHLCASVTSQVVSVMGTFRQEEHGEDIWCVSKQSPETIEELDTWMNRNFNVSIVRLEIEKGKFYYDIRWGYFPCSSDDPSQFGCEWAVQAPGKVGENNATLVEGRTLTWDMTDPDVSYHFAAESSASSGFLGMTPTFAAILFSMTCCCCIILLLAGGGLAVFLIYRRKQAAPDQEEADTSNPSSNPTHLASPPGRKAVFRSGGESFRREIRRHGPQFHFIHWDGTRPDGLGKRRRFTRSQNPRML